MKRWKLLLLSCSWAFVVQAQNTFPVNGVADNRSGYYALTNATIVTQPGTTLTGATLVIKDGRIVAVGNSVAVPKEAVVVDCKGKYIYPSFVDAYSDYGVQQPQRQQGQFNFFAAAQLTSNTKGAFGWNQAIKADANAGSIFTVDEAKARQLRESGFGVVSTHIKDGIVRGTGAVVTLASERDNKVIVKEKATAHYSFSKGTSTQSYPSSLMGSIALLRQTYYDAAWYKSAPKTEGVNMSLQAFNGIQGLPQIFDIIERGADHTTKWNALRADRIGDEFGVQYILKASGYEYQRIQDMKATNAAFILHLNFPQAMDVEDPNDARFVSLADMKHWEMAPSQPAAFEKAGIPFCISATELRDTKQFLAQLRKAIEYGLSEQKALEAITTAPAAMLQVSNEVGSISVGKWANFLVTNGPLFAEKTTILQNWVQGNKYAVKEEAWNNYDGVYNLTVNGNAGSKTYQLEVKNGNANILGKDTISAKWTSDGKMVKIVFGESKRARTTIRLSGTINGNTMQGSGVDTAGNAVTFSAIYASAVTAKADSARKRPAPQVGNVVYPFNGYGATELPKQETILIKNATVWTSENEGILSNTDVLLQNGKIAQIGKNIAAPAGARIIDGSGKHLTAGIIDEHSHIATSSINEGGQSVTSEVRIGDNLNPDDINIYRQLSGGVTTSHILHGSANTIGGQTHLIKLRWGVNDEQLKFAGADGFIKFALGENVKRSPAQTNNRFPDTRMGVEQVLMDAFTRAKEYEAAWKLANMPRKKGEPAPVFRRDLELDALVEIMNRKRFITCHSYVQSEITSTMRVAEKFGFNINTFTHILEGYKVADKMKAHGVAVSTFSDWWTYKMEVVDAIAYNAAIMQRVGLNVAINSDDAEMARRLNQEAAKIVKYGGVSEEEAWKMVTINPATMLHVQNQVGSIKVGKDADVVLWSDNPLSIYAKSLFTIVDGIVYYDRVKDEQQRVAIQAERNRLIQKMLGDKRAGMPTVPATASMEIMHHCSDHAHKHGLLVIDME